MEARRNDLKSWGSGESLSTQSWGRERNPTWNPKSRKTRSDWGIKAPVWPCLGDAAAFCKATKQQTLPCRSDGLLQINWGTGGVPRLSVVIRLSSIMGYFGFLFFFFSFLLRRGKTSEKLLGDCFPFHFPTYTYTGLDSTSLVRLPRQDRQKVGVPPPASVQVIWTV